MGKTRLIEDRIKELEENQEAIFKLLKDTSAVAYRTSGHVSGFFTGIIIIALVAILKEPISFIIISIKDWLSGLSEGWQIAIFLVFSSIIIALIGFFLNRVFPPKNKFRKGS